MTDSARRPLARRTGQELRAAGLTISLVEVGTGGAVTSALTDIPGSSAYVVGAVTALSPGGLAAAGCRLTDPTAEGLGHWVRERLSAGLGVSVIGRESGRAGYQFEIAVAGPAGIRCTTYRPRGNAADVQPRVVRQALRGLLAYLPG